MTSCCVFTPCFDFATTCYDTMAHAYVLRTLDLDTEFFHTDMKVMADHFHGQPTVLYCVPTNPGPRSRTTHDAMLHSALWCCAPGLDRIQHSVHSKSLALKCTEHSVLSK